MDTKIKETLALPWNYRIDWWEDSGGYFACTIEEVEGVAGDGSTPEEALSSFREAFSAYLECLLEDNLDLPQPAKLSDYKGQLMIRTKPIIHYRLAKLAKKLGVSVNKLLEQAVELRLSNS
ncbi:MAG: toxin-antitoxin system HicB family antitoxin [Candidatus Melainabacteria bacterium]|nr:toxin-antitoxin system HicB family antitoxin [Candidatus Melainabacteria bacterium]